MCVIFACENDFPSLETLKSANEMNPHGAGVAWLDKQKNIHFKKGLKLKDVNKMIKSKELKLPCIIHFRIASVGGVSKELTHPFIISKRSPIKLSGILPKGHNGLFFHNGSIIDYETMLKDTLEITKSKRLKGKMSDSRVMAFMSAVYGHRFVSGEIKGWNKFAVLDSEGIHKYGAWGKTKDTKSVKESNNYYNYDFMGSMYSDPDDMNPHHQLDDLCGYGLTAQRGFRGSYETRWGSAIPQGRNERAFEDDLYKRRLYDPDNDPDIDFKDGETIRYDPNQIDGEIDNEIALNVMFNEVNEKRELQDVKDMQYAEKLSKHPLRNRATKKEIREMNIAFLTQNGWALHHNLNSKSNKKINLWVEVEQRMQHRILKEQIQETEFRLRKAKIKLIMEKQKQEEKYHKDCKKYFGVDLNKTEKISMENYENAYEHMVVSQANKEVLGVVIP